GDVAGYNRVKAEISRMINNLKPGTLFNIYAFDDSLEVFRPRPVAATAENRAAAARWIERFWTFQNGRFTYQGARGFEHTPDMTGLPIRRNKLVRISGEYEDPKAEYELQDLTPEEQRVGKGSSRMDLAILAAAEGGADAIFMITDGTPSVTAPYTESGLREFQKNYRDYWRKASNDKAFEKWREEMAKFHQSIRDHQEARKKKGLPPEIKEHGYPDGFKRPAPPKNLGNPPWYNPYMKMDEIVSMIGGRAKEIYREKKREMPPLHVVGYSTKEREEELMGELQRPFRGGQFRLIEKDDLENFGNESDSKGES
ncbi:MAG: hypothetical protein ACQKBV_00575, partial [Puniceicoccales bacterium]